MEHKLRCFSPKQKRLLTWWCGGKEYDAVVCDGSVRSGKTVCMSLSFVFWAFSNFDQQTFALCGKTVTSLKRNVISPLIGNLKPLGFQCDYKVSAGYLDIRYQGRTNRFYLFGGKDEGSAALIQGMTLAGVMFDEVALMPRSFVEQALARCSVSDSRFWFNCNPEHPFHWFYQEWIQKAEQKRALYLHFTMDDNPSLSPKVRQRYQSLYSGTFYDRFVKGEWTAASGRVYPMFSEKDHVVDVLPEALEEYVVSCDYGIVNPASFGLWGRCGKVWYRMREYYYDSKQTGAHCTDEEYYHSLCGLIGGLRIRKVIVDPSASSFIECIRRHGEFPVAAAKNDVSGGISLVSQALRERVLKFHRSCRDTIREFSLYCWDEEGKGDCVKKENDHAMDDIRYFANMMIKPVRTNFFVLSASRQMDEPIARNLLDSER